MGVTVREKNKGSGVYWVFVSHKGKRTSHKVGTKEAALKARKMIQAKLVLADYDILEQKKIPVFKDYAAIWLEDYIKTMRRESTYERYKYVLEKHIYPFIGDLPINEIKRSEIKGMLLKHVKKYSVSTVCLIRDVSSGVFSGALDDEIISINPVAGITKRMKLTNDKKQIEPMNRDEVARFLATCNKFYPDDYPMFLTLFRTGCRLGELLGLRWGDLDFNGKFLMIKRTYKTHKFSKPKNGKERRVDMSDQLLLELKRLKTRRKAEAIKSGSGKLVDAIFHRHGLPMAQNSVRNIFKRILQKAGMRNMRVHDTRHTYASLLLSDGCSPAYVKEQLGHHSIKMTVDIYGHLIPGSNRDAVNQLDDQNTQMHPMRTQKK